MSVKCLCKIGILKTNQKANENAITITHNGKLYEPIIPWHTNYIADVGKHRDFCIVATKFEDGQEYLTIFHDGTRQPNKCRYSRRNIFAACFPDNQSTAMITQTSADEENSTTSNILEVTSKLYGLLKTAHLRENSKKDFLGNLGSNLSHLQPQLRNYQKNSVQWLLGREKIPSTLNSFYEQLKSSEGSAHFVNMLSLDIKDDPQQDIVIPSGGILAEEVGLGKTVEMISLILLNPRVLKPSQLIYTLTDDNDDSKSPETKRRKTDDTIKLHCVCLSSELNDIIKCSKCLLCQHENCIRSYIDFALSESEYVCPKCWEHSGVIVCSAATIIVSPIAIKLQWLSEINKHTEPSLKVLLYEGVAKQTISPKELASYDVVLTDYNVLRNEIHFMASNETRISFRKERRRMRVNSPLILVDWWRVCLDEAQMEHSTSQASKTVKQLPAIHRWAVTGTPIEQSLDDLLSLLEFIGVNEAIAMWPSLTEQFHHGQSENIVKILQKVMWRTSKADVIDELGIPPQTEFIHFVELNDLEKLFYSDEHADCLSAFYKKIKGHSDLKGVTTKVLNSILQPMLNLRQNCSIPVLSLKSDNKNVAKKFLQPQELIDYMKSSIEIECKARLRSMASINNGMGALYFLKQDYNESIEYYEKVMALSKQYTGAVSVDSLLLIHALYNAIQAYRTVNAKDTPIVSDYEAELNKLELKFLEPYALNLQAANKAYTTSVDAINDKNSDKMPSNASNIWAKILKKFAYNDLDQQLLNKINDEVLLLHGSAHERFGMVGSVILVLDIWYKKIVGIRNELTKKFHKFDIVIENVHPRMDFPPAKRRLLNTFIRSVYDCHLSEFRNKTTNEKEKNPFPYEKPKCELCKAEKLLQTYECLVFDKTLDEKTSNAEGTWNPTMQETILKTIYSAVKLNSKMRNFRKDCEVQLEAIGLMKTEYKELVKLWIEVEYTVKAYDELDMCKMRLSIAKPEEEKTHFSVYEYEIDDVLEESRINFSVEQKEFVLKRARLKYIQHLEGNTDPGPCPICRSEIQSKYVVLECGHHLCFFCLKQLSLLKPHKHAKLSCSVCRNNQTYRNVYYVTRKIASNNEGTDAKGDFSSKIQKIVIEVLKLKQENKQVKIIMFSQWIPILKAIGVALKENSINFKLNTSPQCVEKFKNENLEITCLLMLVKNGSQGLNLVEATHVFLVEPIMNTGEQQQAIGRIHRIGQTKPTFVHRFVVKDTIEENIFNALSKDKTKTSIELTIENIKNLFEINSYDS